MFGKLAVVIGVAVYLYTRWRRYRGLWSLARPERPAPATPRPPERRPLLGDRAYVVLLVTAAVAVAAWIITARWGVAAAGR